jgi:hypothetical protein
MISTNLLVCVQPFGHENSVAERWLPAAPEELVLACATEVRSQFISENFFIVIVAVTHPKRTSYYSSTKSKQIFYKLRNST